MSVRADLLNEEEEKIRLEAEKLAKEKGDVFFNILAILAAIDWHDFVVVDTVEFTEADEKTTLPHPITIADLEGLTLEQKKSSTFFPTDIEEAKSNPVGSFL